MKQDVLMHFTHLNLTCMALIIFFILFVSALIWVIRPQGRALYRYMSELPLEENSHVQA